MTNLVLGVGINDAEYTTQIKRTISRKGEKQRQKIVWVCPFYRKWFDMLNRCYSNKYPTYEGCYVCDEWLRFTTFKSWMEQQDYESKHLDKDILVKGNKVYSPETCVFVSLDLNNFVLESTKTIGDCLLGVTLDACGKFRAQCNRSTTGKRYLGLYDTQEQAHDAWRKQKHDIACKLADEQTDLRVAEALRKRYL